jgi:hypothetical protein
VPASNDSRLLPRQFGPIQRTTCASPSMLRRKVNRLLTPLRRAVRRSCAARRRPSITDRLVGYRAAVRLARLTRSARRRLCRSNLHEMGPFPRVGGRVHSVSAKVGTSQASANSSRLSNGGPQRTLRPLRANETSGPEPGSPAGKCGSRRGEAAMPGVVEGPAPKISVWMQPGATPQVARPAVRSLMKVDGPQI